ncbi:winged helix-turn-helix domain-containing protein [Mesorhizobium newzealandense]|uniref:Winged helix-turn-helix domain-containing protein n=1 Tax=Mesorhizobium newzealandense TaxID=1300302 RepID=A0ABW4U9N6_9HYPH
MPYLFEDFALDGDRCELRRGNDLISVEPQVFDLLQYLIRNRERVVSRDDLIDAVWQGRIVSDATLASRINAARNALQDSGEEQRLIRTILRRGLRFVGTVREEVEATAPVAQPKPALGIPARPSIAVLPFVNMSSDPEQDYFADGMVEDIITGLSRIRWLFVIARNSSSTYKGRAVDVKQVGHELGVRYVLEGSVRKVGSRVRITGQLIDAEDGSHIWAERYDRELTDVFALQDEITISVVAAIEPNLRRAEIERVRRDRPNSLDAYDLLLRALPDVYTFMPQGAAKVCRCSTRRSPSSRPMRLPTALPPGRIRPCLCVVACSRRTARSRSAMPMRRSSTARATRWRSLWPGSPLAWWSTTAGWPTRRFHRLWRSVHPAPSSMCSAACRWPMAATRHALSTGASRRCGSAPSTP